MTSHLHTLLAVQAALAAHNVGFTTYAIMVYIASRKAPTTIADIHIRLHMSYQGVTRQIQRTNLIEIVHLGNRGHVRLSPLGRTVLARISGKIKTSLVPDNTALALSENELAHLSIYHRPPTAVLTTLHHPDFTLRSTAPTILESIADIEQQIATHNQQSLIPLTQQKKDS